MDLKLKPYRHSWRGLMLLTLASCAVGKAWQLSWSIQARLTSHSAATDLILKESLEESYPTEEGCMTTPRPGISSEGSLRQIVSALPKIWPVTSQWYDVHLKDISS